MAKLNQVIAIEGGIKSSDHSEMSQLYKIAQKPELFDGHSRIYTPKVDGEDLPNDNKRVQFQVPHMLKQVERSKSALFTIEARKDWTNTKAHANVVVDGEIIIEHAPPTFLLFLEKQLVDMKTFIGSLPILDESYSWNLDPNDGLQKTDAIKTQKTQKNEVPLELSPATDKHPAQVKLITKDEIIGWWSTVKQSGAISKVDKAAMLDRIEKLHQATVQAREEANGAEEVKIPDISTAIFGYLFPVAQMAPDKSQGVSLDSV